MRTRRVAVAMLLAAPLAFLLLRAPNARGPAAPTPISEHGPEGDVAAGRLEGRACPPSLSVSTTASEPGAPATSLADLAEAQIRGEKDMRWLVSNEWTPPPPGIREARDRAFQIAGDAGESERTRFRAATFLVALDGPVLSEEATRVLAVFLSMEGTWLRDLAVWLLQGVPSPSDALVPGLRGVAQGPPAKVSVDAAHIVERWGAWEAGELEEVFLRALGAEDRLVADCALESPLLPGLHSEGIAAALLELMADTDPSLAWCASRGMADLGEFQRRYAALVAASRFPARTRRGMRDDARMPERRGDRDEILARLCLDGPDAVTTEDLQRLLVVADRSSLGRVWAALRVLLDQDAIPRELHHQVARLAVDTDFRGSIPIVLNAWVRRLPEAELERMIALDGDEYFAWRLRQLAGISVDDRSGLDAAPR